MSKHDEEILTQAVERNLAAVLSLPSAGMFRLYKTRFLSECPEGIWTEGVASERPLIDSLITDGHAVGISFKSGQNKVSLAVPILRVDPAYRVNTGTAVQALLLQRPVEVKALQRRTHYRVPVNATDGLSVQLWRINETDPLDKQPMKAAELKGILHNLSVGGLGVVLDTRNGPQRLTSGERIRVILRKEGNEDLLVEGRGGSPRTLADGRIEAGIQFIRLQDRLEGRQILSDLTRLVGALQREEVKRRRLKAG